MKNNLIYYIMTYVMFLYPPFIFFMVMINFEDMTNRTQSIVGASVNLVFVLTTTAVLYLASTKKKIPKIEKDEKNHFIFGYIGNIVMFLYTYQYNMNIERYVSVFSLVLLLIFAYQYLVSKKIAFKEILIFGILFGVYDYLIIIITGNTLFGESYTFSDTQSLIFQILFLLIIIFSVGYYIYKLWKFHHWSILRFILISFLTLFLMMLYIDIDTEEIYMTFLILAFFTWLVEIILKLIHKEFKVIDLVFYARIILLTMLLGFMKEMKIYQLPDFEIEQMGWLIGIFYVSGFSDVLMNISPKEKENLNFTLDIVSYIKKLYGPITSRYKDILIFANVLPLPHQFDKLGRDLLIKHLEEFKDEIDTTSLSLIIIYSENIESIKSIVHQYPLIVKCVISQSMIRDDIFDSCYTDYHYYIHTISS